MIKTNQTKACKVAPKREDLNRLMEAVALIIARRQMKLLWAAPYRAL